MVFVIYLLPSPFALLWEVLFCKVPASGGQTKAQQLRHPVFSLGEA